MVGVDVKSQMVANLCLPQSTNSVKRLVCPLEPLSSDGLASCLTERTTVIFDVLQLNEKEKAQNLISKDTEKLCDDPSYQDFRMAESTMSVVNAERAIALMQQYSMSLKKNEEQEQFLCIVNNHRNTYRSCSKATLMKMTEDSA